MNKAIKHIGALKQGIKDVSSEYFRLAQEDEAAAQFLQNSGHYRHAAYFFIQAMEKYVRAKIFQQVNADHESIRNLTRTHNLDELLEFLIEIFGTTPLIKDQVKGQLEDHVLEGVRFGMLHNDLRYPFFQEKQKVHSVILISQADSEICRERLERLKPFLRDIDRLRR